MFSNGFQKDVVTRIKTRTGIKPDVSNLRKFDCTASDNIPRFLRYQKYANHARRKMMIGYSEKTYCIFIANNGRIMISRDIVPSKIDPKRGIYGVDGTKGGTG